MTSLDKPTEDTQAEDARAEDARAVTEAALFEAFGGVRGMVETVLPAGVADALNGPILALHLGDITSLGLQKLPYGATTQIREHGQIPLLDFGTIALIRSGDIAVRSGIDHFTPSGAVFADGAQLGDWLRRLVTQPCQAAQMAERGRQYVLDNYTWPVVLDRMEADLCALMAATR